MRRHLLGAAPLFALLLLACQGRREPPPGPRSASPSVRTALAEADALRRAGRGEEAVLAYQRVMEASPDSVPAHLRYVATLLEVGRRSEARRIYDARAARPGAGNADLTMAERLATDGSSSALRRVYRLASEREPQSAWWRLAVAEIEIAEGEAWNRRRLDAIDRSDRDEETKAFAQAQAALERASDAIDRADASLPTPAETELYRGYLRAVEGDLHLGAVARAAAYRAAEDAFTLALRRDPDLVEAWEGLGDVRLRTGDMKGSLVAFRGAVERAPADASLRESLGVVLRRIDRNDEAALQFEEAARLDPRSAGPWLQLGDAYAAEERWEKALAAWAEALRRDGEAIEAYYRMGSVLEHVERPGEARAAYERYLSQGGTRSSTVRRRVERLLREESGR